MFKQVYLMSILLRTRFLNKILISELEKKFDNYKKKNEIIFNEIEIIFKLPSEIENKQKFILMLILLEKYLNNKLIFLFDKKTFSNLKWIKIGCFLNLKYEMLINYLYLFSIHSIPKIHDNSIIFDILKTNIISYEMKKILFNTLFNIDKDIHFFYDYLGEFNYKLIINFRTKLNNGLLNELLLNTIGIYFSNSIQMQYLNLIEKSWLNVLLLLEEEEEEDNEVEKEDIIENITFNVLENVWQEKSIGLEIQHELDINLLYIMLYEELLLEEKYLYMEYLKK